ncbi:MAG: chromosome segregation protein SMC [Thermoflexales bacterium]|nr:chromosome segregation protein SMC [Thermoflexales bacterium]
MRLKTLVLNGYKTFAGKTRFEFGEGITCIIGPNGSGKSNIADGIRWALGEQQFSLLRGKKTDDMIFSGSARRPRASMAEVILTFDNSDGFFPIEFSEIEIGRRAYRDGTNEYVLNGNRVRLRDVTDLLAHSGLAERTYTVIGQGLVDEALAQKPEERRALFEEAAGIAGYRDRREDALRKLEETHRNLERARDILNEITPRLKQLERQVERARQHRALADELGQLTRTWLGYQYRRMRSAVEAAAAAQRDAQRAVAEALDAVNMLDAQGTALREMRRWLQARLTEAQPRRDAARQTAEAASRDLAVMRERVASLERQVADARRELDESAAAADALAARADEAQAAFASAEATYLERRRALEAAESAASGQRAERAALEEQRAAAQRHVAEAGDAVMAARDHIASLRARQDALRQQLEVMSRRASDLGAQREAELAALNEMNAAVEREASQTNLFEAQYESAVQTLEAARAALEQAQSALAAAEAEERLTSRMTIFADMRAMATRSADELAAAAAQAGLPAIHGVLSSFIQIAPDDQKAVEAALGELLNAIVIAPGEPAVAEAGLVRLRAWLTEQVSGRIAVVVTHALRPYDDEREANDRILNEHARACHARPLLDAIGAPDWLRPAMRIIAGRKFITRDLDAARALAAQLPDGCLCVTRDGEIAHAIGTLSLPAGERSPIILGDETELPEALDHERALANLRHARHHRDEAQRAFEAARRSLEQTAQARDLFNRESAHRRNRIEATQRKIGSLEESLAMLVGDMERLTAEVESLDRQLAEAGDVLRQREAAHAQALRSLHELDARLNAQLRGGWLEALTTAQAMCSAAQTAMQNAEALRRERAAAHADALAQHESRARRLAELTAQLHAAQAALQTLADAAAQAEADRRAADAAIAPLQSEIAAIEAQIGELDERRREAERRLRERESQLNAATLDLARHNDELESLRRRAWVEIEGGAPTDAAAEDYPSSSDAQPSILESLPIVEELPAGIEERIAQLRAQIKRLGAINDEAQAEFEELSRRYRFIAEQCNDLEKASAALRQVIAELNDVMKDAFRQTFDAIAQAFQSTFKVLFGGGQARLSLVNSDNIDECGIEIHAQPPGKRPQSLALLSGGERALTATALLFAILQVKPTPFCVLDEVDAALDESNVGRFRAMLESLSDSTQFIVITHNRRTVEAATTIYGISMGADGASTALSLRLDEVALADGRHP